MRIKVGMKVTVDGVRGDYGPLTVEWVDAMGFAGVSITYPNGSADLSRAPLHRLRPVLEPVPCA